MRHGRLIGAALGATAAYSGLDAQEFRIAPAAFTIPVGSTIVATGRLDAPLSRTDGAVRPAMVADARLIGAGQAVRIRDLWRDGALLRLRYRPERSGQYVVAVALEPRTRRTTQATFIGWLRANGADREAARLTRERAFESTDSVTYRSAAYATAVVNVGSGPRAFSRAAGFPIDIIPRIDPAEATAGDTLAFRLEIEGDPISQLVVQVGVPHASDARIANRRGSRDEEVTSDHNQQITSDHNGMVRVPVPRAGVWSLSTVRVVILASPGPTGPEPGYWDVTWSTYVFKVAPRMGR